MDSACPGDTARATSRQPLRLHEFNFSNNAHTKHLHGLALTSRPRSGAQLRRLYDRRRMFAALLQRRSDSVRLITSLNDGMSLAERRDPSYELLKQAGDQAYDELIRRHPNLYRHIRAHLARYETRYGRLELTEPRAQLRARIYDELDRMRPAHTASPAPR
ncbi:hypothetical protein [Streptomyces sp. NPDC044948]|uniref:hypothetical protein n=1 Tax=Streptomyces sp. NPDC044948 TaxID=3157092 RepID=UPI0033E2059F